MKFLHGIIIWGLAMVILAVGVSFASEEQPWLIDRPEEVAEVEEPPIENFWGYEYTPIVITWYGEHVPKLKHELKPFRAFGAVADGSEALAACEEHVVVLKKLLETTNKQFGSIVVCLGRYIVKPVEEEEEK